MLEKNNEYKLMAFMHIHRAKDDTLNSCIRLTFEITSFPGFCPTRPYGARETETETETMVGSGHVAPEQNYFCETLSSGRSLHPTVAR